MGRSFCPQCKHQLAWKDNIPLLSFCLLRGRCRSCHSPISWQYPLVELGTGLLFLIAYGQMGKWANGQFFQFFYYLIILSFLIVIFVSDLRYGIIPDEVVFPVVGLAVLFHLRGVLEAGTWLHLGGVLLAALGAAGFFLALVAITKGKGMGMGDVKLVGLMGLLLGWPEIVVALYLAFLTGAMVGVILIFAKKRRFGQTVPFGPFLVSAAWVVLFWGDQLLAWFGQWL